MNELISIQTDHDGKQTVSARELHKFLGSKQEFSTWIKGRIKKYGFQEKIDFVCMTNLSGKGRGGHNAIEYHLFINMAKELSMVEQNEKGQQARQYFIECEHRAKDPMIVLNDPAALRSVLMLP